VLARPLVVAIGVSRDISSNSGITAYFVPESPTVMVMETDELDVLQVNLETATSDDVAAILSLRDKVASWLAIRGVDLWQSPLQPERLIGWIDEQRVLVQRDRSRIVGTITLLERDEHIWGDGCSSWRRRSLVNAALTSFGSMPVRTSRTCRGGTRDGGTTRSTREPSSTVPTRLRSPFARSRCSRTRREAAIPRADGLTWGSDKIPCLSEDR